jgi:hypothetical protein
MGEAFIVRKGGVVSDTTAAPTITIVTETDTGVTFTLTNNDDNTAIVTYEIDDQIGGVELAAAATSSNITVALAAGTYTLTAYATVVGEVATSSEDTIEIVQIFEFELLFDSDDEVTLPQTEIDITGLSIGKNDELRLVYTFVGSGQTALFVNGNNTNTNYHSQELTGLGTTIAAARYNISYFNNYTATRNTSGYADIKVSNNDRFVVQNHYVYGVGAEAANLINFNFNIVGTGFTLTSITSLKIANENTDGIDEGSRIRLYKVNTGEA